jgi:hypothetical protein
MAIELIDRAQARGVEAIVYGLPFCLLPGRLQALAGTAPVVSADSARTPAHAVLLQRPRCRSCALANRCPGAPRGALEREGEGTLRPLGGRPVEDDERSATDRLLA